ncbi:hypothetical protein [Rickettsia endosymbiont of Ceutorhynchus obstrictus]|uniref:hypothetical protein n=1 Tax=Rickettsia endosymbiont of Ceutorhynchus obstrictus TaxID=3066249 RepID=UPI003132AC84
MKIAKTTEISKHDKRPIAKFYRCHAEDIKNGITLDRCRGISYEQFRAADRLVSNYERAFNLRTGGSVINAERIKQIKNGYNSDRVERQLDALHSHKLVFGSLNRKSQEIIEHFCLKELPMRQFELKQIPQWIKGAGTTRLREALDDLVEIYQKLSVKGKENAKKYNRQ